MICASVIHQNIGRYGSIGWNVGNLLRSCGSGTSKAGSGGPTDIGPSQVPAAERQASWSELTWECAGAAFSRRSGMISLWNPVRFGAIELAASTGCKYSQIVGVAGLTVAGA